MKIRAGLDFVAAFADDGIRKKGGKMMRRGACSGKGAAAPWARFAVFSAGLMLAATLPAIDFGVKAGASLSFAGQASAIYNASNLLGAKGGVFVALPLGDFFFVEPGVLYVLRGGRYYSATARTTQSARFHYLEVPVLLGMSIMKKRLSFCAGPYYGLLLGSTPLDAEHSWTWKDFELRRSDFGVAAGLRLRLGAFLVEMQSTLGLVNVMTDPSSDLSQPEHHNRCLALLFGFVF
jgi:hypothetical protein